MVCPLELTVRMVGCGIGTLRSRPYVLSLKREASEEIPYVVGHRYHLQVESLSSPGSVTPVEDHCIAVGVNGDTRELTKCLGCLSCGPVGVDAQVRTRECLGLAPCMFAFGWTAMKN